MSLRMPHVAAPRDLSRSIQLACAALACLLLPFDAIPVDTILTPRASVYPVLAGSALWALNGGFGELRREMPAFVLLIALHCLWMTGATLHGLYEMRGEQGNLLYPALRCAVDMLSFWAAPLWFAGLLRRHGDAFAFLARAFTLMFALLALYGSVDALHLICRYEAVAALPGADPDTLLQWCLERDAATAFLRDSAPWFRKVAVSDGWWPPALWGDPRLRSFCGSPPFLAQLLCLLLPLFWFRLKRSPVAGAALLLPALAMLALTKSVSGLAVLITLALAALLFSRAFTRRMRIAALCGLCAAAAAFFAFHGQGILEKLRDGTGRDRTAVTLMEFGIMLERPFLGAGYRLTGREMERQFHRLPFKPGVESRLWHARQAEIGPLKTAAPALNAYSRLGAEGGFIGLALFAAAFACPVCGALRRPGGASAGERALCCMLLAAAVFWMGEDSRSSFASYLVLGTLAALAPPRRAQTE